jgi:hypothetical protein
VKLCGFDVGLDRPMFLIAGPNSWPLALMGELLETLAELDRRVKKNAFAETKVKSA